MNLLLLMTASPQHADAAHAIKLASDVLDAHTDTNTSPVFEKLQVFFYQDAASIANRFIWLPASDNPDDVTHIQQRWQQLAVTHQLALPVCVSAALARGVTDAENAKRHQITQATGEVADNLADHFQLVGLGDLAEKMHWADKVVQL